MKKMKVFFTAMVLLASSLTVLAQNITVTGTVKDEEGAAIVGANLVLRGDNTVYTMTDLSGAYRISVPSNGTLLVSCMGYQDRAVNVDGRKTIDIILLDDSQLLDETIVVAYGTATKSSFTGSAAQVKAETIEKKVTTNVTSALAGTTPGVQVTTSSGDPTANGSTIRIRGIGSISGSNSPLVIVDGVPYDGGVANINPQDVESMSVLKDAAASAIYGHRGANGVILITTKKGSAGDAQVKFDARVGVNSRLIPQYDVITNPAEYYETHYKFLYNTYLYSDHTSAESYAYADATLLDPINGGLGYQVYTVPAGEKFIGTDFKVNPHATLGYYDGEYYYTPDDWYKETYRNSVRQEYNISASGSSGKMNYYTSVGYLNDNGIIPNSAYSRYTGRINAEYQAKSWMRLTSSMGFTHGDSQSVSDYTGFGSSGNIFYIVNNIAPIYPLYVRKLDANGNPYIVTDGDRIVFDANQTNFLRAWGTGNAVRDNLVDSRKTYTDMLNGKFALILTPISGLTLNANVGFMANNRRYNALGSKFGNNSGTDGYADVEHYRTFTVNEQFLAEYKFDIAEKNHFDILAGYESYNYKYQELWGYNDHLYNPYVGELGNADGIDSKQLSSYTTNYMTQGFLSRIQYDFDGRYFLSGSFRRDASSRFAKGHRWGNFGSVGAAWLMSKENWFNASFVDMLKFKLSYGVQGNDDLNGNFPYSDQYSHSYDGTNYSLSLSYKGNEDLTWETSKSFNVGVDFELFKGYLNGTIELFDRRTEDLLYFKSVPLSSGNPTGQVPVNVGTTSNKGWEISLDGSFVRSKNVNWTWNLNLSHYTNKILELDPSVSEDGIRGSNYIRKVGGSIYEAYMYKFAGVDPANGDALYYAEVLLDENGNYDPDDYTTVARPTQEQIDNNETKTITTNKFSEATQYDLGTVLPKVFGGFGTSLNAYGFDLSAQFQFQLGGKYYDGTYQALMHTQTTCAGQAWHRDVLNAWTPENTTTNVPRLDRNVMTQTGQSAVDNYLISSNYLSINNVTLGYTLPAKLVKKVGLSSLRIYVAGENLAVLTARKGIDPRFSIGLGSYTSGTGLNSGYYSTARNITGGITLTF